MRSCSVIMINTNRTKYRTTLTNTHLNLGAIVFAMDMSDVTLVPYGPGMNNDSGNRLMERLSTLNNRVKGGVSGAFVRSGVLGYSGKPTIRSLHTRTSGRTCDGRVEGALRGAPGLAVGRKRMAGLLIRSKGVAKMGACSNTACGYGTIILYAKACLGTEYVCNSMDGCAKPGKLRTTGCLASSLGRLKVRVFHFGAKAPTHVTKGAVSCDGVRRRFKSREIMPFSFSAGPRSIRVRRGSY